MSEPAFCVFLDASAANSGQNDSNDGVSRTRAGYSVTLSQPIFEGFQNLNAIHHAKATVQAGREGLRAVEQRSTC
jgi:outer membrane protein TolC